MNFLNQGLFILSILFIVFIFFLLFVPKSLNQKIEQNGYENEKSLIGSKINLDKESNVKYFNQEEIEYWKSPKWGGVRRNPVCCKINPMNSNFYDSQMYP